MMQASVIPIPGFYWYQYAIGVPAVLVEIGPSDSPRHEWIVTFSGTEKSEPLAALAGYFTGPIPPP